VLGANVVLTMSTKIIDVTGLEPVEMKGYVPERSVVIPGAYSKQFNAGTYQVPCALIIGKRKASTDLKHRSTVLCANMMWLYNKYQENLKNCIYVIPCTLRQQRKFECNTTQSCTCC
jgi:hypothetical protein